MAAIREVRRSFLDLNPSIPHLQDLCLQPTFKERQLVRPPSTVDDKALATSPMVPLGAHRIITLSSKIITAITTTHGQGRRNKIIIFTETRRGEPSLDSLDSRNRKRNRHFSHNHGLCLSPILVLSLLVRT